MTEEKTNLTKKDTENELPPNNYRPIMCLQMMWKILTAQIKTEIKTL